MIRLTLGFLLCILPMLAVSESGVIPEAFAAAKKAFESEKYEEVIEILSDAIHFDDTYPELYSNRALAFTLLDNLELALEDIDTALNKRILEYGNASDKRLASLFFDRGYTYAYSGKPREALEEYEKAIELDANFEGPHGNAAWILATSPDPMIRDGKRALEYALIEAAKRERWDSSVLDTLAAAYAACGQFDEAIETQKLAIAKAQSSFDKAEFRVRLHLYREKTAYIECQNHFRKRAEQGDDAN